MLKGMGEFFAIDIGTRSIRVVQLENTGPEAWQLLHAGYAAVDEKIIASDSPEGRKKLSQSIMSVVGQANIKAKDVVIGLPSTKTFTTVVEIPKMTDAELAGTLKYQIDQYIPMSVEDAKVDWAKLGDSPNDAKKQEVLLASTAQSYVETVVEMIDGLGFNVIAAEPDPIAITRSLLPAGTADARVIMDLGELSTDIVITVGGTPRLVRTLPLGLRSLVGATVQNLNIKEEQATQFILKFGLAQDKLEGQVYRAIENTLDNFVGEITKSIKFFSTKYTTEKITALHLSGYAAVIPSFAEYIQSKANVTVQNTSPWQKVTMTETERQKLASVEYEFATAIGLAERTEA